MGLFGIGAMLKDWSELVRWLVDATVKDLSGKGDFDFENSDRKK